MTKSYNIEPGKLPIKKLKQLEKKTNCDKITLLRIALSLGIILLEKGKYNEYFRI